MEVGLCSCVTLWVQINFKVTEKTIESPHLGRFELGFNVEKARILRNEFLRFGKIEKDGNLEEKGEHVGRDCLGVSGLKRSGQMESFKRAK